MKQLFLLSGFLLLAPLCAPAQVTIYPAALQQLAGIAPPPPPVAAATPVSMPVIVQHWRPRHHVTPAVAHATPPAPTPVAARVPAPPPEAAKPAPAAPKLLHPLIIAFAPGSSDLPANATAALKPYCTAQTQIAIDARAPSDPTDPSAAMRLSLSRAMAVQAALTACGVPPQNILPRANGNVPGKNEDETIIGGGGAK